MSHTARAVILGGGLNGLSLARCLGLLKIPALVVDRESHAHMQTQAFDGRTTAVSYGMRQMLTALGLWQELEAASTPILDIDIRDGESRLYFNSRDVGDHPFGYIVENHRLRRALWQGVQDLKTVKVLDAADAGDFEIKDNRVHVESAKGRLTAELLVGADGRQSLVRRQSRIRSKKWAYDQIAIVFMVAHTEPHHNKAWECFFPQGPLALLPMAGNVSQVVWTMETSKARDMLKLTPADLGRELADVFGDDLGALEVASKPLSFPLSFNHAYEYVGERVALVGDAAHGLHPIAGQGLNVGMRDVATLAELIAEHQPEDLGDAAFLKIYDRKRKPDSLAFAAATDGLNRLFGMRIPLVTMPRRWGVGIVERTFFLKRFFMQQAMGQGGNIPGLFRGCALT